MFCTLALFSWRFTVPRKQVQLPMFGSCAHTSLTIPRMASMSQERLPTEIWRCCDQENGEWVRDGQSEEPRLLRSQGHTYNHTEVPFFLAHSNKYERFGKCISHSAWYIIGKSLSLPTSSSLSSTNVDYWNIWPSLRKQGLWFCFKPLSLEV